MKTKTSRVIRCIFLNNNWFHYFRFIRIRSESSTGQTFVEWTCWRLIVKFFFLLEILKILNIQYTHVYDL